MGQVLRNRIPSTGRLQNSPPYVDVTFETAGGTQNIQVTTPAQPAGTYPATSRWIANPIPGNILVPGILVGTSVAPNSDGSSLLVGVYVIGAAASLTNTLRLTRVA